ncbi:MAG: DUF86 domain-containing protein [Anaerolineales bacterium]|nr:DUF86 domain-containing protein [Anaerolineales bacterium]
MVKLKTLTSILNSLQNYRTKLTILAGYSREEFVKDFTKVESTKHLLQVSIECCLDLAHHLAADEGYRTPQDSYDAFAVLNEEGILPDSFMPTLRQMVSFRNRVVHIYWDVDDSLLYDILQQNLGDFEVFVKYILSFIDSRTTN